MKRLKRHKGKREFPETSTSKSRDKEEHDLTHYINDRVEMMHQVFSLIKPRELKAMAPECARHISIDDLQELCTEELLGISSKRLHAILDGAEPPTDTESSSSEHLETISLDSISSDEEILSQSTSKKKHKHKKHKSKSKHRHSTSKDSDREEEREDEDQSRASRAGLTVLELLELQARARAIRAQLQQHQVAVTAEAEQHEKGSKKKGDSSDEVEIKEEPAEVVEISSEEEKPKIEDLPVKPPSPSKSDKPADSSRKITKKSNDLIVTVPQSKSSQKIVLKRNKNIPVKSNKKGEESKDNNSKRMAAETCAIRLTNEDLTKVVKEQNGNKEKCKPIKCKSKKKHKKKDKQKEKDGSDHDEITLQLSDTEKMDLLEDFDRKNYENFTSSSEDSESSSGSDSDDTSEESNKVIHKKLSVDKNEVNITSSDISNKTDENNSDKQGKKDEVEIREDTELSTTCDKDVNINEDALDSSVKLAKENDSEEIQSSFENKIDKNEENSKKIPKKKEESCNVDNDTVCDNHSTTENMNNSLIIEEDIEKTDKVENIETDNENYKTCITEEENGDQVIEAVEKEACNDSIEEGEITNSAEKDLSDGEICDADQEETQRSEVNTNVKNDVISISDEDDERRKKKKRKDKRSKKDKKSKKSKSDFREGADQNFFREKPSEVIVIDAAKPEDSPNPEEHTNKTENPLITLNEDGDDIYEILELSDDSSCYEVEGISISKEPTTAEIEALSVKIDNIHTEDIIEEDNKEIENVSWRDRYLDSKKVKQILTTSNILNALRKKNKLLMKKLEESKSKTDEEVNKIVEGSIEQFNTLEGSTKYVDPVVLEENKEAEKVTKEMETDAKKLLKMYKRLLKYNDMNKTKDKSQKKKKKKNKKSKDKITNEK